MTRATRWRRRAAAAAVAGLGLVGAGCAVDGPEAGGEPDLAAGKGIFVSAGCAGCHTLADSGQPPSQIGPNLDDSWRASRQAGIDDSQFAGTIERWIAIAQMPMPRNLTEGQDTVDVAAYIASVAGRSAESGVYPATTTPEVPSPPRQDQY